MSGASHACVPIAEIKSTCVASVLVGVTLCDVGVWHLLNVCIHSASNIEARWTSSQRGAVRGLCHGYRGNYVTSCWPARKTKLGDGWEETRGTCGKISSNVGISTARVVSASANGIHWRTLSLATQRASTSARLSTTVMPNATVFIADVERDSVQCSYDLMNALMQQILLHCNMCHLVVVALAHVGDVR